MNLSTGREFTRHKVTECPVTDMVIKAVETAAEKQGHKSLKFYNRHKIELHPADWIAGVDYETHNNNDSDDEDEDYIPADESSNVSIKSDFDDEDNYDPVEQHEIDELMAEDATSSNPTNGDDDNDSSSESSNNNNTETNTDANTDPTQPAPTTTNT